jgi:hypothetical protein
MPGLLQAGAALITVLMLRHARRPATPTAQAAARVPPPLKRCSVAVGWRWPS